MGENNSTNNSRGWIVFLLVVFILGSLTWSWWQGNQEKAKSIEVCIANEQNKILDEYYYNKDLTPSSDEIVAAYQWAKAKCE